MVHVVVMVMVVMMMVMMVHGRRSGRRRSGGVLRVAVAGKAEREHSGSGKGLDHGRIFLRLGEPQRVIAGLMAGCLNSI